MSRHRDLARACVRLAESYLWLLYSGVVLVCAWFGHSPRQFPDGRYCSRCGDRP